MKRFATLLSAVLCLVACHGVRPDGELTHTGSVVIADALSNQKVNGFAEDADGHIWIATFRGLNQYDVHEYHQYYCTDDTLGLPDNQINDVHCCPSGRLWVATVNGVAYRTETGAFRRVPIRGQNKNIRRIIEAPDGKVFFTNTEALYCYDTADESLLPVIRDYNSFGFPSEAWDGDRLWVISSGGKEFHVYDVHDFSLVESVPLPFNAYHLCNAGNGEFWLSGVGHLAIYNARTHTWKELPEAIRRESRLMKGDVDYIYAVDDKNLLLNDIGTGMYCWQRNTGRLLHRSDPDFPYDVPDAEIRVIFRDSHQNLWFGTSDQGYATSYHYKDGFNSNKHLTSRFTGKTVMALSTDRENRLWISTNRDGLYVWHPASGQLRQIDLAHLVSDAHIGYLRCDLVYCDAQGDLWLLFTGKSQVVRCRYEGGQLRRIDGFEYYNPVSIAQDDLGRIWIGNTSPDLLRYDKNTHERITFPITSQKDWTMVADLMPLEAGRMLAVPYNHPVIKVNTNSGETEPIPFPDDPYTAYIHRSVLAPVDLYRDSAGDTWLGTVANGLIRYEHQSGRAFSVPGTPCLDICAVQEDRQGNIWVSTMYGLGRYDRTIGQFVNYFAADGIGGNQFSDRAAARLADGTMVFGGTHGLTVFNPLDVQERRTVPLVFEDLKVHNQLVEPGEGQPIDRILSQKPTITLRGEQDAFSISFAALDYSDHERSHYYYMMEGFDPSWVDAGNNHEAYYANLPGGHYNFKVRITNNNRSIVETEEALQVHIIPLWFRSWWGRILLWLITLGVLFCFWRLFRRIRRERNRAAQHIREVRRAKEQAQQEKEQEQRLNKIQMNYFSNVAHEFRTPLTMIAGPVSELASSPEVKGHDRKLVNVIQRNATWMLSLVNQLLDFNRIGNSKLQLKVAKTDIVAPLKNTVELFRFNADSKRIELNAQGLEDGFVMWADVDKVQKITMNLLSNALKYTPAGGKVSLSFDVLPRGDVAALFPLGEQDTDGQYACIAVADTGPGIPADEMEKIFERFYRADQSGKTQGSGIGLYYARALTGLHHGYLRAWNREEGGAIFRFVLPVSAASYTEDERTERQPEILQPVMPPAEKETPKENQQGHRLVAVVDDDIDVANYVKMLLEPSYRVNVYFDAASALAGMADEAPDLLISDVVMPGMSGYELCEAVKGDLQLSHIPIILVTAKVAVESQVQGLDKGADAYVTKPFQPAYLLALVKSLLENRDKVRRQLSTVTTAEAIEPEALSPRDAAFMKDLFRLMEKELDNTELDVTRISEMMKISRTKFYYKVKGLTGENPSVFFKRYKLNRAADLLKEGKYNMSEIAYMTGFNTLSHFSTSFKKQFGVPPSEYVG